MNAHTVIARKMADGYTIEKTMAPGKRARDHTARRAGPGLVWRRAMRHTPASAIKKATWFRTSTDPRSGRPISRMPWITPGNPGKNGQRVWTPSTGVAPYPKRAIARYH